MLSFCATSDLIVAGSCLGSPTSTTLRRRASLRLAGVREWLCVTILVEIAAHADVGTGIGLPDGCRGARLRHAAEQVASGVSGACSPSMASL